jgi:hypothetical protein
MNNRKHRRFSITMHANILIGEKNYKGVIGNISEEGVLTSLTTFIETEESFLPQKNVELNFDLPTGKTVELNAEVRWFLRPKAEGKTLMLGLYIIDPPSAYIAWIKTFK